MADMQGSGGSDAFFTLCCRGDVRLYRGGLDCTPKSKKGRALLAILAAEQRPLTRIKIIDLLWSDRQEEQARASLRTLLADLKEQFGERFEELLIVDRERIALGSSVRADLTDPSITRPAGELFEGLDHIDPELDEWLRVEREKWAAHPQGRDVEQAPLKRSPPRFGMRRIAALALLAVVVIASAILLTWRPWVEPERPVIAVLKFKDMTGKNALLADGLAEELRIQLMQHPSVRVIGRESSESRSVVQAGLPEIERKLGATHVVEGSMINRDGRPYLSFKLANTEDGQLIWSQLMPAEGGLIRGGSAGIAARIAGNVNDTVGQGGGAAFSADPKAFEEVFAARRAVRSHRIPEVLEAKSRLEEVVRQYPRFAPALAALAEAQIYASDHPWTRGPIPLAQARKAAERYSRRAIAAAPHFGPGYAALGLAFLETPAALKPLRRAVELNPGSSSAQHRLARAMESLGDYQAALRSEQAAAALDPLSAQMNYQLVRMLRLTGHGNEIPGVVKRFVTRTDDPLDKLSLISGYGLETGDFSAGYLADQEVLRMHPGEDQARRGMMWNHIFIGDRARALEFVSSPDSITAIILRDDLPALLRKVESLGRDFWTLDWETSDACEYLYAHGRSDVLVHLYDQRAGFGPETTFIDGPPVPVLMALRDAGRNAEVVRLLRADVAYVDRIASRSLIPFAIASKGQLLIVAGRKDDGLKLIEAAQRSDWLSMQPSVVPWKDWAVFRDVRGDPRFRRLVTNYEANIEREKRELAVESARWKDQPVSPDQLVQ